MTRIVTFGLGGWCEHCDPSHDHPPHNIVEVVEMPTTHTPLDSIGVVATLNAVLGVWSLADAANVVGLSQQDLINEAQAWSVAEELNNASN